MIPALDLVESVFLHLVAVSVQAAVLIVAVLLTQAVLGNRLSARARAALWLLVIARLVLPVTPESATSIYNLQYLVQRSPSASLEHRPISIVDQGHQWPTEFAPHGWSSGMDVSIAATPNEWATSSFNAEPQATAPVVATIIENAAPPTNDYAWRWTHLAASVWLAVAFALMLRTLASARALSRRVTELPLATDKRLLALLDQCRRQSRIGRRVSLRISPGAGFGPAVAGWLRPQIILPKSVLERLSQDQLRLLFLHELAHVRRHDLAIHWLALLARNVHWFNPAVWLFMRRLRSDTEMACDEAVVARSDDSIRLAYGQTALELLRHTSSRSVVPGVASFASTHSSLKRRFIMIARHRQRTWLHTITFLAAFSLLASTGLTGAVSHSADNIGHANDLSPAHSEPASPSAGVLSRGTAVVEQEPDESLVDQLINLISRDPLEFGMRGVSLNRDHSLASVPLPDLRQILADFGNLQWAAMPGVASELDLVGSQQEEFIQLEAQAERWLAQLMNALLGATQGVGGTQALLQLDGDRREKLEARLHELEEQRQQIVDDFQQVLLPHQHRRLEQLGLRYAWMHRGAATGRQQMLGESAELSAAEIRRLRPIAARKRQEVEESVGQMLGRQADAVLATLTADQRSQLQRNLGDRPQTWIVPAIEVAIWQLEQIDVEVDEDYRVAARPLIEEWMEQVPSWQITPAGRLAMNGTNSAAHLLPLAASEVYGPLEKWGTAVTAVLAQEPVRVAMSMEQGQQMQEIGEKFGRGDLSFEEAIRISMLLTAEVHAVAVAERLRELTPEQLKQFETILLRRLIAQRGVHASLLDGNLGQIIGVSDAQRERIRRLVERHRRDLLEHSRQLERDAWETIMGTLTAQQQRTAREKLGNSLRDLPGAPTLILLGFEN